MYTVWEGEDIKTFLLINETIVFNTRKKKKKKKIKWLEAHLRGLTMAGGEFGNQVKTSLTINKVL